MKQKFSPEYEALMDKFFDAAAEVRRVRAVIEDSKILDSVEDCNSLEADLSFAEAEFKKAERDILTFS